MPKALTNNNSKYAIQAVRRLTSEEDSGYVPQVRGRLFFSDGPKVELPGLCWTDLTDRKSDGSYVSGNTIVYLISDEDEARLVSLSTEREAARKAARAAEEAAYRPTGNRHSRPCPKCHSYCYGDCTASKK